jgi:signal transduction histidine kinase
MSHEIRTPMNGTLVFKNLEGTSLDSDQEQSVKKLRAGNNLMVIINDILDFSKLKQIK